MSNAMEVLKANTTNRNLIKHGIAVGGVMKRFAKISGEDVEYWGDVGLLHDVDYERFPTEHLQHTDEILFACGFDKTFIRHVNAHGFGLCSDVEPIEYMEKVLFAIDELTGLIIACALVMPDKKLSTVTVESVEKKWQKKDFAAGVNRAIISKGADMLNVDIHYLITETLKGLQNISSELGL